MEELDAADGFSVHDYRHGLKLIREERDAMHLENRDGLGCPACGEPFEKLFVTEHRESTFGNPRTPICLVRTDEKLLVLTH